MEAAVVVTYRCNNKCYMCHIWKKPSEIQHEFEPDILHKLPKLSFCNVTGGEPFLRDDIDTIIQILLKKSERLVISSNGFYTERIIDAVKRHSAKNLGVRISIEGLPAANDELRGVVDGFDHGLRTLLELQRLGIKDIGFGITVSDRNAADMIELFQLAKSMDLEFATAVVHNSYYFNKFDNAIEDKEKVIGYFKELIEELLHSRSVKNWFRAYFNFGLINYIQGKKRLLPCEAGKVMFFLDPFGEIRPCNGMEESHWIDSMGNLKHQSFEEIWNSDKAHEIRKKVNTCSKNCWMIGTASPAMKKNLWKPTRWILKHKFLKRPL